MTPFSPLTYISRNRGRVISIILILACTCVVFMGGMYIDNIGDTCIYGYEEPSQYAIWYMQGNNNDIIDERSEEAIKETFKENNTRLIDRMFGYSWNGQEIDY